MYRLTDRRLASARPILQRYHDQLMKHHSIVVSKLEQELRDLWGIGYQELKDVIIDMVKKNTFPELAVYYMEHSPGAGVVCEFQRPLAEIYGISHFHHADREQKRQEYWARVFK